MSSSYRDTTVKLEAAVVKDVAGVLPARQTLTAFVREAVTRDVRRRRMRAAAEAYRDLLANDPIENKSVAEWETAPLATEPKKRRARRS